MAIDVTHTPAIRLEAGSEGLVTRPSVSGSGLSPTGSGEDNEIVEAERRGGCVSLGRLGCPRLQAPGLYREEMHVVVGQLHVAEQAPDDRVPAFAAIDVTQGLYQVSRRILEFALAHDGTVAGGAMSCRGGCLSVGGGLVCAARAGDGETSGPGARAHELEHTAGLVLRALCAQGNRTVAQRALAEAEARRKAASNAISLPKELGGRDGPEPVRYGDWENKGLAIDF